MTSPPASGFLAQYAAIAQSGQTPVQIATAQAQLVGLWLTTKTAALFAELRVYQPVFIPSAGPVLITRFRDCIEALGADDAFTVKPAADATAILVGKHPFILGMDDSTERDHDQAILRLAVPRNDVDATRIRKFVASECKAIVAGAKGQLDLVKDYSSTIPLTLVGQYFGIKGPDLATLGAWLRAMFYVIFRNPNRDPQIDQAGNKAATEYLAYVKKLVSSEMARPSGKDTVIARLIAMQGDPKTSFDAESITYNVGSLMIGMIDTTNYAVNYAIDSLLNQPAQLPGAIAAANAGDKDLLLRFIFEALRFNPPVVVLARYSAIPYLLAKDTDHATLVPANRLVYVALVSAMMDETELDNPLEFRLDRPIDRYLHLGWGIHRCFGRAIAQILLVEMVKALLVQKNLRRAPGADGTISYDGPFPKSFSVVFDV